LFLKRPVLVPERLRPLVLLDFEQATLPILGVEGFGVGFAFYWQAIRLVGHGAIPQFYSVLRS